MARGKMRAYSINGRFLRICEKLYSDVGGRVKVGQVLSDRFTVKEGLRQGCILSPSLFSLFLMDLAEELEEKGLGVSVSGVWMGACFFADDIVLLAESGEQLQSMLDVVYSYSRRWRLKFNVSKCGVLVVGQKRREKLWRLGKEWIKEVDEYKYLGVWQNRQATGHNHVNHLVGKGVGLQNLARGAKFWRGEEDIEAGLIAWEVASRPVLNYGAEVWACSSKADEHRLEQIQDRAGRRILGLTWRFPGTVVRGELGWMRLRYQRHILALQYMGKLREMGCRRWPRIVGEAMCKVQNKGTWVDYARELLVRYRLQDMWGGDGWEGKTWKRKVLSQVKDEAEKAWKEEVELREDLGPYKERQKDLKRAEYIRRGNGDGIRLEIKEKCEWGKHFVD